MISKETLQLHHGKHHREYVDATNALIVRENVRAASLEEIVRTASGRLFNNAAQSWNRDFDWHSLAPGGARPSPALLKRLQSDFGGWDRFARAFADAANGQFGSGWAWLVSRGGKLEIVMLHLANKVQGYERILARGAPMS